MPGLHLHSSAPLLQHHRFHKRIHAVCLPLAAFAPPPVADTKANFLTHYSKPIPAIYNVVLQELLVQQHFIRYKPACTCSQSNEVYQI